MLKKVELQGVAELKRRIGEMIAHGRNTAPLMRQIAGIMADEVEENFEAEGRPAWPKSKRAAREGGKTLQDSGLLVASIQQFIAWDATSASVSTNRKYAAIHNFGGEIKRYPFSSTVRLRTDAKGNLLRQGDEGLKANLAVFAKSGHKRTRDYFRFSMGYTIRMPRREFMRVSPAGLGDIEAAAARFISGG